MQPGGHRFETGILHQPSPSAAHAAASAGQASLRTARRLKIVERAERGNARMSGSSKFAAAMAGAEVRFAELDDVLSQLNILQTVVFSVITKHTQCSK